MVIVVAASLAAFAKQTPTQTVPPPAPVPAAAPEPAPVKQQTMERQVEVFPITLPPLKALPPKNTDKIEYVDGMSSQPWSRMVGSNLGWSAFVQPETAGRGLSIFSAGAP